MHTNLFIYREIEGDREEGCFYFYLYTHFYHSSTRSYNNQRRSGDKFLTSRHHLGSVHKTEIWRRRRCHPVDSRVSGRVEMVSERRLGLECEPDTQLPRTQPSSLSVTQQSELQPLLPLAPLYHLCLKSSIVLLSFSLSLITTCLAITTNPHFQLCTPLTHA